MRPATFATMFAALVLSAAAPAQHNHAMPMGQHSMPMGQSGMEALKRLSGREFTIAFLSQMIAHHQGAIQMAQEALKAARHAETKKEARSVVTNQTKEIKQMTAWLQKWYGVKPSQEQMQRVKADMKGMLEMPITDDRMFFEMMIPHHQGAIEMSRLALRKSERAEVKALARSIIRAQESEIARYKRLIPRMK
jgi:uncharacterized protein (DUF305 family)